MNKSKIGLIGLSTMGGNLAKNIANNGYEISIYNRTKDKTENLLDSYSGENLIPFYDIEEFVNSLESPKKIMIMVKAGDPVDMVIDSICPYLEKGDIIVDCGNSFYEDTVRREIELKKKGLKFCGCGVSGGEEGALKGPSMMFGGDESSWDSLKTIFLAISAEDFNGGKCATRVGGDGAGHYVKMVHNGIEYGVMQMIAESYQIYRKLLLLDSNQIASIFDEYNQGKLKSYLFEIASPVLRKKDDLSDSYLIDKILDSAGQKGTGMWTAIEAIKRGVSLPTITESVFARVMSSEKNLREKLSQKYNRKITKFIIPLKEFKKALENALYSSIIISYAQGYDLIQKASKEHSWDIDLSEVSRIWQGGCIIRAEVLTLFEKAYKKTRGQSIHLFQIDEVSKILMESTNNLRGVAANCSIYGVPAPALISSLVYFDYMTESESSANLLQGLRDYFGAHTYKRADREGVFHTDWN